MKKCLISVGNNGRVSLVGVQLSVSGSVELLAVPVYFLHLLLPVHTYFNIVLAASLAQKFL